MAKSRLISINTKIAENLFSTHHTIEDTIINTYTKIEDVFVDRYLTKEGESIEQAKRRLKQKHKMNHIKNIQVNNLIRYIFSLYLPSYSL